MSVTVTDLPEGSGIRSRTFGYRQRETDNNK